MEQLIGDRRKRFGQPSAESLNERQLWAKIRKKKHLLKNDTWDLDLPGIEALCGLLGCLKKRGFVLLEQRRRARIKEWRRTMKEHMKENPAKVFSFLRKATSSHTTFLKREDGTVTANLQEMDELLMDDRAWGGVFRMYDDSEEPAWTTFFDRFKEHIPEGTPCVCEPLTADDLRTTIGKMKRKKAAGLDGWRVEELKELPLTLLEELARCLNLIEDTGNWPRVIARALVVLIPKGEGEEPLKQRPITITSVMYRLWAATRLRKVATWQESWIHERQHGFRNKHGTEDLLWFLCAKMEEALIDDTPVYLASFDYQKCFDRVPQEIMFQLVERLGLPDNMMRPIRGIYKKLGRRFKLPAGLGKEWFATNGILQGCPLSVIFLNALVAVWMNGVEKETGTQGLAYADDTNLLTKTLDQLRAGVAFTGHFADLTGQRVHAGKSTWQSNRPDEEETVQMNGADLTRVEKSECLGATVQARQAGTPTLPTKLEDTIDACGPLAGKVGCLPLTQGEKAGIMQAAVMSKSVYGITVQDPPGKYVNSLATAVEKGVHGVNKMNRRSVPVMLNVFEKGHLLDPSVAFDYRRIMTWAAMIRKSDEICLLVEKCRSRAKAKQAKTGGPIGLIARALSRLAWSWIDTTKVKTHDGSIVDVKTVSLGRLGHVVRERMFFIRLSRTKTTAKVNGKGRANLKGIEAGVDKEKTLALTRSKTLTDYEAGTLRHIVADGAITGVRLARARIRDSAICVHCEAGVDENHKHLWWECEAWSSIRAEYPLLLDIDRTTWPNCLAICGMCTPDTPLDCARVADLQKMMVRILIARSKWSRPEAANPRLQEDRYPWTWAPELDTTTQHANSLVDYTPLKRRWPYGRALLLAFASWLGGLQWSDEAGREVSHMELLIDFEVATGMDIRPGDKTGRIAPKLKQPRVGTGEEDNNGGEDDGSGEDDDDDDVVPVALAHREMAKTTTFGHMLASLRTFSESSLHPGKVKVTHVLASFGANAITGIDRRPIFAGGEETLKALRALYDAGVAYRLQRSSEGMSEVELRGGDRARGTWMGEYSAETAYPSTEVRGRRALPFIQRAEQETSAHARYRHHEHVRPGDAPVKAPEGAVPIFQFAICVLHRKTKCDACSKNAQADLMHCCFAHHSDDDGLPIRHEACTKHRLSRCGNCVQEKSTLDHCCRRHHDTSKGRQTTLGGFFKKKQTKQKDGHSRGGDGLM